MDQFILSLGKLAERWDSNSLEVSHEISESTDFLEVKFLNKQSDFYFEVEAYSSHSFVFRALKSEEKSTDHPKRLISEMWEISIGQLPNGSSIQSDDQFVKSITDRIEQFLFNQLLLVSVESYFCKRQVWLTRNQGWRVLHQQSSPSISLQRRKTACLNYRPLLR